jgi:peroxiredoxin
VRPLKQGQRAPDAMLARPDGELVRLAAAYSSRPSILIFYRGGWCPYCNTHLGQIAQAESELVGLGYQVLAISPDRPEALRESLDRGGYTYQLLSDSEMTLAQAFGLAFRVDDQTIEKYRSFGIDLEQASGRNHHLLPVPAVYIIDTQGIIRCAHWDADYTKRLEPAKLIAAARRIVGR